tara:strand:+ start:356 stop:664 length:309 start_codon:yes stop_codon:yes gene_type:complete
MKKINIIFLLYLVLTFSSCGTVKEGFKNQRKDNSDEFLVEKKSPLVMPPDYNELPLPNSSKVPNETSNSEIEELIFEKSDTTAESESEINLENLLLEKIKKQ